MGEKRTRVSLPEPSRMIGRAAEAAADAGDLGAELLSTGVDAATGVIGRLTSVPEETTSSPRRQASRVSGSSGVGKRVGATVKRAAKTAATENRKVARAEASAGKKVVAKAQKAGRKVVKAAKPSRNAKAAKPARKVKAAKRGRKK